MHNNYNNIYLADDPLAVDLGSQPSFSADTMWCRVYDCKNEIQNIRKNSKESSKKVNELLIDEIRNAADGNIIVPQYSQRLKSEQETYCYDGTRWMRLDSQRLYDIVRKCLEVIGLESENLREANYVMKIIENFLFAVSSSSKSDRPQDEAWINFPNGTLKIKPDGTSYLDVHRREDMFMYVLPYKYDPSAECPRWKQFLDEVLPDPDAQRALQEHIGLLFYSGSHRVEKMPVLVGSGANGKSVFLKIIECIAGEENTTHYPLDVLTTEANARAGIENKLLNVSQESNKHIDFSVFKEIVSGDPIVVKNLYCNVRTIREYARTIASFNVLPDPELTYGFERRWSIFPFNRTFKGKEADKGLFGKLEQELPGIMNWALEGLVRLIANDFNFTESGACERALEEYRHQHDSLAAFVHNHCVVDAEVEVGGAVLMSCYISYCRNLGYNEEGKIKVFSRLVKEFGVKRTDHQRTPYFGIRFKEDDGD